MAILRKSPPSRTGSAYGQLWALAGYQGQPAAWPQRGKREVGGPFPSMIVIFKP